MGADELAEHRIAAVRTLPVEIACPDCFGRNAVNAALGHRLTTQVRVLETDGRVVGWGRSLAASVDPGAVVGLHVADLFDAAEGTTRTDLLALDFALHDLVGRILGRPVYQLVDGRAAPELVLYHGSIDMPDIGLPPEIGVRAIVARCEALYGWGHRAFKLKIGRGFRWMSREEGLERDVAVTRGVRARFPDCRILVDANDGLTVDDSFSYLPQVEECGLFWIEEPFPEDERPLEALRTFLQGTGSDTLVADGETNFEVERILRLSEVGMIDVAVMDVGRLGFARWRSAARRPMAAGTAASPHTCCNPLNIADACHLVAAIGSGRPVEAFVAWCDVLDGDGVSPSEGRYTLINRPGFGLDLAGTA